MLLLRVYNYINLEEIPNLILSQIDDLQISMQILEAPLPLNHLSIPLPIQYLGSKSRISSWIIDVVKEKFPNHNSLFDLFAGGGSVAYAGSLNGLKPILNDIQPYSFCLLNALFKEKSKNELQTCIDELKTLNNDSVLISDNENYEPYLRKEKYFFDNYIQFEKLWKQYETFCQETPSIKSNEDVDRVKLEGKWNLITSYYANTYFGVRQSLQLDLIRKYADKLPEHLKHAVLGTVISVMTYYVSSTTHLAQYLKINSYSTALNLISKRKLDILEATIQRLKKLSIQLPRFDSSVYNEDFSKGHTPI
jgi:adenine-specific DNA-methyltransferase